MMSENVPYIQVAPIIGRALKEYTGQPAVITVMIKYIPESDWIQHRIWLAPGWVQTSIWKHAYQWVYNEGVTLHHPVEQIEGMRLHNFKIV